MNQFFDPAVISNAAGFFPFIVLITSLLGSWHCAGMCGPIACSTALRGQSHQYHFGRGFSYTLLGLIAGFTGETILSSQFLYVRYAGALLMGALLVSLGFGFFFSMSWPDKFISKFTKPFAQMIRSNYHQKFILGFTTVLLPCGWLYSFVMIAASTKSAALGATTMFIFWVGTVPALTMMSAGFSKVTNQTQRKLRRWTGAFFILAGAYSLAAHLFFAHH